MLKDFYKSYSELKNNHIEGSDFEIETISNELSAVLLMAPHGGWIESGTNDIARAISNLGNYSYYAFLGKMDIGNIKLHITSTKFDEPKALEMAQKSEIIITIHGCRENENIIYVSGLNIELRDIIIENLRKKNYVCPFFSNENRFAKSLPTNICNKGEKNGVQIEISKSYREMFLNDEYEMKIFSKVVQESINHYKKLFFL